MNVDKSSENRMNIYKICFIQYSLQMNKFGLYTDKSTTSIPFENHLEGLEKQTETLLLNLRKFVKSLGTSIIEEVRPHRIVYAKSLTFRTFLDIQPSTQSLLISLRKGRTEPVIIYTVKNMEELEEIKHQIAEVHKIIK
jgi:hypothetical protein